MRDRVDLRAPLAGRRVGRGQAGERGLRDDQVPLGIADEVLHDSLRLRVGGLAPVRPEGVVAGEADVARGGHHLVRDHAALQAAHPVREHHLRDPAELLEALSQHRQRGLGPLVAGEPHEPDP